MKIITNENIQNIPILTKIAYLLIALILIFAFVFCIYQFIIAIIKYKNIKDIQNTVAKQEDSIHQLEREILDVGLFYHKMQPEPNIDNETVSYKKITKRIIKLIDQFSNWRTQKSDIEKNKQQVIYIQRALRMYSIAILSIVFVFSLLISQWTIITRLHEVEQIIVVDKIPLVNVQTKKFDKSKVEYVFDENLEREIDIKKQTKIKTNSHSLQLVIQNISAEPITRMTLSMHELQKDEIFKRFRSFDNQLFTQDNKAKSTAVNISVASKALTNIEDSTFKTAHIMYLYFTNEQGQLFKKELLFIATDTKESSDIQVKTKELGLISDEKNTFGVLNGATSALLEDTWMMSEDFDALSQFKDKIAFATLGKSTTDSSSKIETTEQEKSSENNASEKNEKTVDKKKDTDDSTKNNSKN